jgi:hypothetical protein
MVLESMTMGKPTTVAPSLLSLSMFFFYLFSTAFTKCMNYHWILYLNTTTGVISGAGTAHFSRADEFIPVFCEVHAAQSLFFCEKTIVLVFSYSALHCVSSLLDICWFGQNTVHIIMSSDSECPNYH